MPVDAVADAEDNRERAVAAVAEMPLEDRAGPLGIRPRHRELVREQRVEPRERETAYEQHDEPRDQNRPAKPQHEARPPLHLVRSTLNDRGKEARTARQAAGRDPGAHRRALAGPALLRAPARLSAADRRSPHRGSAGVPGRRRARGNRSREPADLRRRPDAGRRRRPLPARQRSLLPHGDRGRALPATAPVRRADRPGGRERGIPTGSADGDRAGRRARAGAREDHDQDRAGPVSELLSEERLDELEIPNELPVLPLKETVVFPQSMTPLAIGQERSIKLVEDAVDGERLLALVTVENPEPDQPGWDDLHEIGTAAVIHKLIRVPDGTLRILVHGARQVRLERRIKDKPYLVGEFAEVPDEVEETPE